MTVSLTSDKADAPDPRFAADAESLTGPVFCAIHRSGKSDEQTGS